MLITKHAKVKWNNKIRKHYVDLGYVFTKNGDEFIVKVEHLTSGSHALVEVQCDYCLEKGIKKVIKKKWKDYLKQNLNSTIQKDCCESCKGLKIEESNMLMYGVPNVMCIEENKEKLVNTMKNRYGVENYSQTNEYKIKYQNTSISKYGTLHPFQSEIVKDKIYKTNLNRYGVKSFTQTKEYLEKAKQTNNKKYGCDWAVQSDKVRKKINKTVYNLYGVKNVFQSEIIKNKSKNTMIKKYGVEHNSQIDGFYDNYKEIMREKYGVDHPLQLPEIKDKIKKTNLKKYGVEYPLQNEEIKKKQIESFYKNGTCPTSKQQLKIYNLLKDCGYNVELNYPVCRVNIDIALFVNDIKIAIEYDSFYYHKDKQVYDRRRDEFLKKQGYKILRIKSGHLVPSICILLSSIDKLLYSDINYTEIVLKDWKVSV